jgi:predicted ArsR family transcriptional regulator
VQETRRQILNILRTHQQATVDDIVSQLENIRGHITPVTVRHHLTKLQADGLVVAQQTRHRSAPGRPQHVYTLTTQGATRFPNNYIQLSTKLLQQLSSSLPEHQINVIFEGIATSIADDADIPDGNLAQRLDAVVEYLSKQGYDASWEATDDGYRLDTYNCPYHHLSRTSTHLCEMDMRLISKMLGVVPRLVSRMSNGDQSCSYHIPEKRHM